MFDYSQNFVVQLAWAAAGLLLLIGLAILVVAVMISRARNRPPVEIAPALEIDVSQLPDDGPPTEGPCLRLYNVPVRLSVLVLAPAGRDGKQPRPDELDMIVEHIVPGLAPLLAVHQTLIKVWPPQLSRQGFINKFFANVPLPGDHGKGTPWCSVTGRVQIGERILLAGLVLCADAANGMAQIQVEHDAQWYDMLRITES